MSLSTVIMMPEEQQKLTPYKLAQHVLNKYGNHFDITIVCCKKDEDDMAIMKIKVKKVE